MGWDYYTYEAQPPFFLDEIKIFMYQENEKANDDNRKAKAPPVKPKGYSRHG
jgi:hypothetical protein